jgi:hypothetical protein
MGRHVARKREMGYVYIVFVEKPEIFITLRETTHIWEDNIRMHLGGIMWKLWPEFI